MNRNILQAIQLTALTIVLMFGGTATTEAYYSTDGCDGCGGGYDYVDEFIPDYGGGYEYDYIDEFIPDYGGGYEYDYVDEFIPDYGGGYEYDYIDEFIPDYGGYAQYDYIDEFVPDYGYNTPSYGGSSYSFPSFSSPSYSSYTPSYSSSNGGSSYATANPVNYQTQTMNNYGSGGGSSSYPVYVPVPQQTASQPINIVNNNVNTNVNTNTAPVAPVYQAPVYVHPAPAPTTPQCAIYATASKYQGGKVTLSWATEYGDTTKVHCDGGVLGSKRVSPIDTKKIYPWSSTTCYATVTSYTGASNSCSVYVPVEKAQPTYVAPVYTPTYTPPVVVQQPIYTPTYSAPTPTYTPPVVTVASTIIPTYVPRTVVLSETPYTGFDDPIWMFTYIALMMSAGYAAYAYYPAMRGRKKFSVVDNY